MAPSTSDHRRFSILVATNGIVACALVCLTVYTVSMHSNVSKLTDSLRDMESKFQAFKMDDNTRTAATRQQLQKLSRELHKTRQRRSLDLWRMTGIQNRIFNGTMFVSVLLKGAPGPRGPPGKEGPQGHTGLKGKGGERGRRGKPGPMGLHGIKGDPGSIGMPGPRGAHGKVGAKGEKGDRGERGITGMKGESVAVPKITAPPSDQTVVSPGTATFTCEATGNPKPIVTILAKGRKIDKRYKDIGEGMLEVSNVTFEDHGKIECVAKSVIGEDRKKADLKVLVKAHAIIQKKTIKTEEGHDITMRCDVKGNPEPIITWQKTGSKLPTTASFTDNNKVLEIVKAKLEDSGEYSCKAVNSLATSRSAAKLSITRRLAFAYRQRGTLIANEKNSITLTCFHKHGVPPIISTWTKNGVKINANKKTKFSANIQVIELRDLQFGDAGNYKCIIKSKVSQIQNTVQLIVRKLHPSSCSEIRKSGFLKSRAYLVFPGGDPTMPIHVYCDMDSKHGEGITQFKTCSDMRKAGQLTSGSYLINATGDSSQLVRVYCNMDSKNGAGITQFKTCSDMRKAGQLKSGSYQINPTGDSSQLVRVYCEMDSKPGEGVTVISHDSEARTRLQGVSQLSYKKSIRYQLIQRQIQAIIRNSKRCVQFIKFECFESLINGYTLWVSAAGQKMTNWGGADHTVKGCACSLTNSCAGGATCNCNKNDKVWREDSGYLNEKEFLPVKELWFGDLDQSHEDSYYTLGKLKCH